MRTAVSMWSLVTYAEAGKIDTQGFVRYAREIGAEGVELLDVFWEDESRQLPQVREALRETGLPVSAYAIGNDLVQPDEGERQAQIQSIRAGVDMARTLGTSRLRVFSGSEKDGVTLEQGMPWIIDGLRQGAHYAEDQGIMLVLENHGLFAGRADQVRAIIEEIGSPALRANVDTGNFLLVQQDPTEAARDLASLTGYVHLKDFRKVLPGEEPAESYTAMDGTRFVGTVIGDGEVDLPAVLDALRSAGYDDWLSIEYEGTGDAKEGLEASVAATRDLIARATGS